MLDGKVVLVTGAGRGIGRAHALMIASRGAAVVVNDVGADVRGDGHDETPAADVAAEIRSRGGTAIANLDDISDWAGAESAVRAGIDAFGRLDGLVNNAGSLRSSGLADLVEDDFDALVRVHLKGSFACTSHSLRYWRSRCDAGENPNASVVNTISDAVLISFPRHAIYSAVKAGIVQLTTVGSRESAAFGVRLNAYGPRGLTRQSQITYSGVTSLDNDEPHPKSPGNSSPLVAWLLSDQSAHVTGQVFQTLGGGIARCEPWSKGEMVLPTGNRHCFDPAEIGSVLDSEVFSSRIPGNGARP